MVINYYLLTEKKAILKYQCPQLIPIHKNKNKKKVG